MSFKMASEIPPHLPLRKGGEQYPLLWLKGVRGDFSEECAFKPMSENMSPNLRNTVLSIQFPITPSLSQQGEVGFVVSSAEREG
jgi:hypothetical protein